MRKSASVASTTLIWMGIIGRMPGQQVSTRMDPTYFPNRPAFWPNANLQRGVTLELPGRGVTILTSLESREPMVA